jgi:hypothetical protein
VIGSDTTISNCQFLSGYVAINATGPMNFVFRDSMVADYVGANGI